MVKFTCMLDIDTMRAGLVMDFYAGTVLDLAAVLSKTVPTESVETSQLVDWLSSGYCNFASFNGVWNNEFAQNWFLS